MSQSLYFDKSIGFAIIVATSGELSKLKSENLHQRNAVKISSRCLCCRRN